jgi:hypothetical protein
MRRLQCMVLALTLAVGRPARGDAPNPLIKEGVGWALVVVGIVSGVLASTLVLQNVNAPDYPAQRATGYSAMALGGAALLCGVLTLNVPPKSQRGRLMFSGNGLSAHF